MSLKNDDQVHCVDGVQSFAFRSSDPDRQLPTLGVKAHYYFVFFS